MLDTSAKRDAGPGGAHGTGRRAEFFVFAIINDGCLAEAGIVCRSCGDACAVSAIRFQARIGLPPQAIVKEPTCTGCGDCVAACPGDAITLGAARRGDIS